ncbi:MAG: hypothetical protein HQ530_05165 [Parcubacteria group bacterium]|nr:hypothetical protein [Parcubacteria group bacterium]
MARFISKVLILLILLLFLTAVGGFWVKKNIENVSLASLIDALKGEGKIKLSDEEKASAKDKAWQIKNKVYEEATEHNPEGDVLPDEIDDKLKQQLKEEAKKRIE